MENNATSYIDYSNGILCLNGFVITKDTTWADIKFLPENQIDIYSSGWCYGGSWLNKNVVLFDIALQTQILYRDGKLEIRLHPEDDDIDVATLKKIEKLENSDDDNFDWQEVEDLQESYHHKKFLICTSLMEKITQEPLNSTIVGMALNDVVSSQVKCTLFRQKMHTNFR